MRICDLDTGRLRATRAFKQLREEWTLTQEVWKDANQVAFERDHLQPLKPQMTLLLAAVHRLSEVLEKVERDCRDEDEK